jgi:hypothetical protein
VKRSGGKGMEMEMLKKKKTESAVVGALGCDGKKKRSEEIMAGDVGWVV